MKTSARPARQDLLQRLQSVFDRYPTPLVRAAQYVLENPEKFARDAGAFTLTVTCHAVSGRVAAYPWRRGDTGAIALASPRWASPAARIAPTIMWRT